MPFEVFQGKFIKTFSGAIEEKGKKLILRMTDKSDLERDILTVNVFTDFLFYVLLYISNLCDNYFKRKNSNAANLCSFHKKKYPICLILIFVVTSTK